MDALRRRRAIALLTLVVAAALTVVGCGSGSSSSSASSSSSSGSAASSGSSSTAKGSPITTMTIASVNYNGPTYQNILETATTYAKWINAHGGIDGHPLVAMTCDEMGVPSGTASCARKAIAAHAVADVGSFSYNGATIVPIYQAANVAWFGICCAIAPAEFHSPVSFPLGNNPALNPGGVWKAAKDGCKKIAVLELQLPTTPSLNVLFNNTAKAAGYAGTLKFVPVALTTTDYTPQVTEAASGTDCISMYLSESNISGVMSAFGSTGGKQKLYGAQGNFDPVSTKGFDSVVKDDTVYGTYPDLSSSAFANYRDAISTYKPPSNLDYNSLGGLGTWTAFVAFTNIVKAMKGPINNKTFLAAATKTANVNTGGILPPINFTKPYTGLGGQYPRAFNLNEFYFSNPQSPTQIGSPVDLTSAIEGK
jgi:ABC-type branched-subunit amino acid transport system substrate-binding protein